jgi:hypothetical protein
VAIFYEVSLASKSSDPHDCQSKCGYEEKEAGEDVSDQAMGGEAFPH